MPTAYPDCDWHSDKLAMIIGLTPGIQYCMQVSTRFLKCCDRVFLNTGWWVNGSEDLRDIFTVHPHSTHLPDLIRRLPHPSRRTFFSGLGCQGRRVAPASLRTEGRCYYTRSESKACYRRGCIKCIGIVMYVGSQAWVVIVTYCMRSSNSRTRMGGWPSRRGPQRSLESGSQIPNHT